MAKTFTLFLTAAPYSGEGSTTAVKIASAALDKGHPVNIIASGDGIYCFLKGQKAKGVVNAEDRFSELISKGLKVYL